MPQHDRDNRIDETDAKGGSNEGVVRWVLLISLALAIVALTVIWVTGALTQDNVESQGTATGRIEAEGVGARQGLRHGRGRDDARSSDSGDPGDDLAARRQHGFSPARQTNGRHHARKQKAPQPAGAGLRFTMARPIWRPI